MAVLETMYPNENVSDEVKDSPEYGSSVGEFIQRQWFGSDNRYTTRLSQYEELRHHMKGETDLSHMFDILGLDPDASKEEIDYTMPRVVVKFVNDVVDGFSTKIRKIKALGIDPISNQRRSAYGENLKKYMVTKGFIKKMDEATGINMMPDIDIPESEDEHNLHMRFDYHTTSEIVAEDSIDKVMALNKWNLVEREIKEDLVLIGEGGVRVKRNGGQITYERIIPENFVYSTDLFDASDRRGTFYYGHVRRMTIGDFRRFASSRGEILSDDYIQMLIGGHQDYISKGTLNGSGRSNYEDEQMTITVLDFAYKTSRHITKKKRYNSKGGYNLIDKKSDFKADSAGRYDVIQSVYDVWYEGLYPIGGPGVVGYRLMDNMPRKRSNLKDCLSPFIYFTLRSESIGRRILPYAKSLNINFIKIQQHIAKSRPDGVAVDISALMDIEIADGKTMSVYEILKEFNTSGNLLYDGEKLEGDYGNKREPIRDNPAINSDKLGQLIRAYLHNIQQIRDETGIANTANPDPNSLIGVQKIALANSQVAVRHILDGMLSVIERLAESTIMHLQMISKYKIHAQQLANAIGWFNTSALQDFDDIGNLEYSIDIELEPEEEERAEFKIDLANAMKAGFITFDEKIDIERFDRNLKYASQLLKIKIKKRRELIQQDEQRKLIAADQMNKAKMQDKITEAQQMALLEVEKQKALISMQTKSKMDLLMFEMELNQKYGNPELRDKITLEEIKASQRKDLEEFKDDRKDDRLSKTSSQNSKMIDQREKKSGPIDFETEGKISSLLDE